MTIEISTDDIIDSSEKAWKLLEAAIIYLAEDSGADPYSVQKVVEILLTNGTK